jgi:hypothetical protein
MTAEAMLEPRDQDRHPRTLSNGPFAISSRSGVSAGLALLLAAALLFLTPALARASSTDLATAYQLDPAQEGYRRETR